jgi:hypothetical protein
MIELAHVNFCSHYEAESKDELMEIFAEVKGIDSPDFLPHQDTYYHSDEVDDSHFIFSDHSPGGQVPVDGNEFELDFKTDENQLHVHVNASDGNIEQMFDYFSSVLPVKRTLLTGFSAFLIADSKFDKISVTGNSPENTDISALRLSREDENYNFVREGDSTRVRFDLNSNQEFERGSVIEVVNDLVKHAEDYVEEVGL